MVTESRAVGGRNVRPTTRYGVGNRSYRRPVGPRYTTSLQLTRPLASVGPGTGNGFGASTYIHVAPSQTTATSMATMRAMRPARNVSGPKMRSRANQRPRVVSGVKTSRACIIVVRATGRTVYG